MQRKEFTIELFKISFYKVVKYRYVYEILFGKITI